MKGLRIKIFADGAVLDQMVQAYRSGLAVGFTTNPTFMRKAGVSSYESFARDVLVAIPDAPVSFEVISDEFGEMERQARKIASWGSNVYVKIPVTNAKGEPSLPLIRRLSGDGIKVNITAILLVEQVEAVSRALCPYTPSFVSVFAGRISDTGRDPIPTMKRALEILRENPNAELLWASAREVLNIYQADQIGCHIITAPPDILAKLELGGRDLAEYSLDTVKTFYEDALAAGYQL